MNNKDRDMFNLIINRSLRDMSKSVIRTDADSIKIQYKFNSYGYRCEEFNNQEILTLGCSQTEGHGLPIDLTWPYLLSKKMNKDYINLAKGGEGAQAQIAKAFQFFKEFYNPKYIFAVFPLTRLEFPLVNLTTENKSDSLIGKGILNNNKLLKYSKSPHNVENVLPEEFGIFYNILFIKMLIQYCESNNIKLIWTAYGDGVQHLGLSEFKGYFDSLYFLEDSNLLKEKCHLEFYNNKLFNHAADQGYWPIGHFGLHKHLHFAENMYNML